MERAYFCCEQIFNKFPRGWQVAPSSNTTAVVGEIDNEYKQTPCDEYTGEHLDSREWR